MVCVVCLWRRFAEVRWVNTAAMVATSTVKVKGSEGIWEPAERRAETAGIDKGIRSAGPRLPGLCPGVSYCGAAGAGWRPAASLALFHCKTFNRPVSDAGQKTKAISA